MTTAMRETPNLWVHVQEPSEWCGRSKHILLTQRGWKARKIPAMGKVFLLTVPFIERTFRPGFHDTSGLRVTQAQQAERFPLPVVFLI
jgi:hypothetical protein